MNCAENVGRKVMQYSAFVLWAHRYNLVICFCGMCRNDSGSCIECSLLRRRSMSIFTRWDDLIHVDRITVEKPWLRWIVYWSKRGQPIQRWPSSGNQLDGKGNKQSSTIRVAHVDLLETRNYEVHQRMKREMYIKRTWNCRHTPQCT